MEILKGTVLEGETTICEGWSDVVEAAERERESMVKYSKAITKHELSPIEAIVQRSDSVTEIFTHYELLGDILDRHEVTIHSRWLNKSKAQRRAIILSSWKSDMAPSHRPDWEFLSNGKWLARGHLTYEDWEAMRCPQVNQENLTKPRSLLLFLSSRARNHPANFAAADLGAMNIGMSLEFLKCGHLPHYVMMFTANKDVATYGKLVKVDVQAKASERPHVLQCLLVGEGLLVLQAQERILKFLVACARRILHDVSDMDVFTGPVSPAHKLPDVTATGFASLAVMVAEAPYRVPRQLDLDRIVSLLDAKRSQAADHLRSLREDPGYFHRHTNEVSEHRLEMLVDKNGVPNPDLESKHEVEYWTRVLYDSVFIDYLHFEMFTELFTQAEALQQLYRSNSATIQPERDLPEPYMHAILKFRYFLNEALCLMSQRIPVYGSLPWREHYYCTVMKKAPGFGSSLMHWKEPCRLNTIQLRLNKYLSRFTAFKKRHSAHHEPENLVMAEIKMYGWPTLMDGLNSFIESEPEAKAMITPFLASCIGELSILSECLHQVEIYQPWARTYDAMMTEDRVKLFRFDHDKHLEDTEYLMCRSLYLCGESLGRLGAPTNGRFAYPIDERMTRENVAALRKAESNLDAFWSAIDGQITKTFGPVRRTAIHRFVTQSFDLQRTPAWIEPRKSTPRGPQHLCAPLAELELGRRHVNEQNKSDEGHAAKSKSKTKTRGAAAQVEPQAEEPLEYDTHDEPPKYAVDARALKVFKTIFFTPSITATPGEIKWPDFLHAMTSVGTTPEKLYGSVWHFSPTNAELQRSINFHEPHKDGKATGKIPYCIARGIGRRLNRAFGWDGSRFVLAEK